MSNDPRKMVTRMRRRVDGTLEAYSISITEANRREMECREAMSHHERDEEAAELNYQRRPFRGEFE